jgi:hypothetical protein
LGGLSTYFGVSALINKLEWMESTNE